MVAVNILKLPPSRRWATIGPIGRKRWLLGVKPKVKKLVTVKTAVRMAAVELKPGLFLRWGIYGLATGQQKVNLVATRRARQQSAVSVMRPTSKPKKSRRSDATGVVGQLLGNHAALKRAVEFGTARMDAILTSVVVATFLSGRIFRLLAIMFGGRSMMVQTVSPPAIGLVIAQIPAVMTVLFLVTATV